jgi:hypothetical protein
VDLARPLVVGLVEYHDLHHRLGRRFASCNATVESGPIHRLAAGWWFRAKHKTIQLTEPRFRDGALRFAGKTVAGSMTQLDQGREVLNGGVAA